MIFFTSEEKAVIRRYAIVCQLWREGDQDFLGLEYDMAAGCSILARRIAIDARSRHIIAADAGGLLVLYFSVGSGTLDAADFLWLISLLLHVVRFFLARMGYMIGI